MATAKPRILIVEDEPGIADTLQYALRTEGFEPHWVATGEEALAQTRSTRCSARSVPTIPAGATSSSGCTTPDIEGDARSSVMYVAAPIRVDERIIGAVSAAKPVQSFGQFVDAARRKTLLVGATSVAAVLLLMVILSVWLVRPFGLIADYVAYVRSQRSLDLPRLGRRAIGALGAAYDEMRDALAGRSYVADYVQTLTHELKSPLSAIRGAAELLREPMPSVDRRRERARPWPRHSRLSRRCSRSSIRSHDPIRAK